MRFSTIAVLSVTGAALLGAGVLIRSPRPLVATVSLDGKGIKSLLCNNVEYIADGEFHVERVAFRKANGETYQGEKFGAVRMDVQRQQLSQTFPLGLRSSNVPYSPQSTGPEHPNHQYLFGYH